MSMILLNTVRSFFRKHPAYEPDLVELSAVVYILSCKMVGVKTSGALIGTPTKCRNKQSRTD